MEDNTREPQENRVEERLDNGADVSVPMDSNAELSGHDEYEQFLDDRNHNRKMGKVVKGPQPHTSVPRPDPNKTEGGIALDAMISNLLNKYNAYRDERRRRKVQEADIKDKNFMEHMQNQVNGPSPRVPGPSSPGPSPETPVAGLPVDRFRETLRVMVKRGIDLNGLYTSGDMERLFYGRVTNGCYTLHSEDKKRLSRTGQLFLSEDGKVHCAPKKNEESLVKTEKREKLTEEQKEKLRNGEPIRTEKNLLYMNPKTLRVRNVPLENIQVQDKFRDYVFSQDEKAALLQGEKLRVKLPSGKITFLSFNPVNRQIKPLYPKDLVPKVIPGITLTEKEKCQLAEGKTLNKEWKDGNKRKLQMDDRGKIRVLDGQGQELSLNIGKDAAEGTVKVTVVQTTTDADGNPLEKKQQNLKEKVTVDKDGDMKLSRELNIGKDAVEGKVKVTATQTTTDTDGNPLEKKQRNLKENLKEKVTVDKDRKKKLSKKM